MDKRGGVVLGHLFTRYPDVLPDIIGDIRGQGHEFCRNTGATGWNIPARLSC
ncbi:hypothetical protein GCM10010341_75290 [Streptomyces noursei]|nr:hypothetical protein GCM10010341_75290 [Streptomyces noursei]